MLKRKIDLESHKKYSCFLWGPRQSGKSTLLKELFPDAIRYDLLLSTEFERLIKRPSLIREECEAQNINGENQKYPIIIDEVQKVPAILDEVHWLIENKGLRFILCGSSARKLKRGHGNLLGGRAVRYELFPLVSSEIPDFDLYRCLNHGMLPRHYLEENPVRLLNSYISDYLKEEIMAEALTRNIPAFSRFLESAALTNGEFLNYKNIAQDCGVSSPTVKEYFTILEDTLIGKVIHPFRKRPKRRVIGTPKFYFFDLGITGAMVRRKGVLPKSELFGRVFEHFIYQELIAHSQYSEIFYPVTFWRTASQLEVDFILGDHEVAIEVKGVEMVMDRHLKGLKAFMEEYSVKSAIIISLEMRPRRVYGSIDILPYGLFLERLWNGKIIS